MRSLIGSLLIIIGGTQLFVTAGLAEPDIGALWPIGTLSLGLWFLVVALRSPERRGLTIAILAISLAVYELGMSTLGWPDQLHFPLLLVALELGVLLRTGSHPTTA